MYNGTIFIIFSFHVTVTINRCGTLYGADERWCSTVHQLNRMLENGVRICSFICIEALSRLYWNSNVHFEIEIYFHSCIMIVIKTSVVPSGTWFINTSASFTHQPEAADKFWYPQCTYIMWLCEGLNLFSPHYICLVYSQFCKLMRHFKLWRLILGKRLCKPTCAL